MEYGNIVISNNKVGFVPRAIRFFTKSGYSHSFFTIPPIAGKELGLEASDAGVAAVPFDSQYRRNKDEGYVMYRFKADTAAKDMAIGEALETLQVGYGFTELAWFIWRAINKKFGKDIKHQNNWSQAGIICSELVASYISNAGYAYLFEAYGYGSVNAQDILDVMQAHPELFELIETKE